MTRHHPILLAFFLIFTLLAGIPAGAQTLSSAKNVASEPTPTKVPAPTSAPEPTKIPQPTAPPLLPRVKVYLPLLHAVLQPAASVFWADRYLLQPGECTQIHWAVTNYPSAVYAVYLNDMPVTSQDTRWVCPVTTAQYRLRVVRSTSTEWYSVTIVVESGGHPLIEFSADAYQIRSGECTTLRWRVTGARVVYLDHEGVAGESSRAVCPDVNTTYELRVEFTDEIATRRITISVLPPTAMVLRFWAEQYTLPPGACTTLHWYAPNAREVYLDDQGVPGVGDAQVCPVVNQSYMLRAVDWVGRTNEREIALMVGDPELRASEVIAGHCQRLDRRGRRRSNTAGRPTRLSARDRWHHPAFHGHVRLGTSHRGAGGAAVPHPVGSRRSGGLADQSWPAGGVSRGV